MFSANTQTVVKATGYIQSYNNNYEIGINYGNNPDKSIMDWSEKVVVTESGDILEKHKIRSPTKLSESVSFLTEPSIKILVDYFKLIVKNRQAKLVYAISSENKISTLDVKYVPLQVSSYYQSTKNPLKAQRHESHVQQKYSSGYKSQADIFKNPKIDYIESSHHLGEHIHSKSISLLNGNQLVQNIINRRAEKHYTQALVKYISETLKVKKDSHLIYQSVCVSQKNHVDFGLHGASYIIDRPDFFIHELQAIKQLQQLGYKSIKLSIPAVKDYKQVQKIKEIIRKQGITRTHKLQLLINIQVPSALFTLDALLSEGVDGVIFDIKNIGQLLLGMDNEMIKKENRYYDQAILHALSNALEQTKRSRIPLYINMPEHDSKALELIPQATHSKIIFPV